MKKIIWFNGSFIDENIATIPVTDRGFLLGDGIFDTMAAKDGDIFYAEEHINRLFNNADVLNITIQYTKKQLLDIAQELLQKNEMKTGHVSLRTTITRGTGARGILPPDNPEPTILMTSTFFNPEQFKKPAIAIIAQNVRRNEGSPLSRIKSINYGDNIIAQMEAKQKGADTALMMNNARNIACATNGNIFIIENKTYITPPISDGVLGGIIREKIIKTHHALEENINTERLLNSDSVFITNSILGIRPVEKINDTVFNKIISGKIAA